MSYAGNYRYLYAGGGLAKMMIFDVERGFMGGFFSGKVFGGRWGSGCVEVQQVGI